MGDGAYESELLLEEVEELSDGHAEEAENGVSGVGERSMHELEEVEED